MADRTRVRPAYHNAVDRSSTELPWCVLDSHMNGVGIFEPLPDQSDLWVVYANAEFQSMKPYRPMPGHLYTEIWPEFVGLIPKLLAVAETGEPWITRDMCVDVEVEPGTFEPRYFTYEVRRVIADGRVYVAELATETTPSITAQKRLELLYDVNTLLLESDDPEAVIQVIAEKVKRHLNADVFFNYVLDEGATKLRLNAWGGVDERVAKMIERLELGQAICGCVARDGERIISRDVQNNGDERADLVRRMGVRCYVCHPILIHDSSVGTLSFGTKSKDSFSDTEIDLMRAVTAQVSVAVEKSRLLQEQKRRRRRIEALHDVMQVALSSHDVREATRLVLAHLSAKSDFTVAAVWLERDERLELISTSLGDAADGEVDAVSLHEPSALARAYTSREPVVAESPGEADVPTLRVLERIGVRGAAYVIVPLMSQARTVGVLQLGWSHKRTVSSEDLDYYVSLGAGLGVVLENARLYQVELENEERFRAVLENSLDAAYRRDLQHDCYDYLSPVIESIFGFSTQEFTHLSIGEVLSRFHPDDREHVRRSIEESERTGQLDLEYRFLRKDGTWAWVADKAVVMKDDSGVPRFRSGIVRDITERKRIDQDLKLELGRTGLLLEAASGLNRWTDVDAVLEALAEIILRATEHTRVVVALLEADGETVTVAANIGENPVPAGTRMPLAALSDPLKQVLSSGEGRIIDYSDLPADKRGDAADPYGLLYALFVPIVYGGRTLGCIMIDDPGEHRTFSEREMQLIDGIASQAAIAIENASRYEAEHQIAETLQETLIVVPRSVDGIAYSRAYESATSETGRVGGDFIDVFRIDGSRVGISLGDVSGKGIDAAVTTSLIRTTLRVHAIDGQSPARVAKKANDVMGRLTEVEAYVTLWFGLLDTETGHLRYVCAGHPPALVLPADGPLEELKCHDPILGAFANAQYYEAQTVLAPGDRLVLYTDGATEAKSPADEFLNSDGFAKMVTRHASTPTDELAGALMQDIVAFSDGVLRDDVAILTVEATGAGRA